MDASLILDQRGEAAVIGLARSGRAAALLLARHGRHVYVSDAGRSDALDRTAAELRAAGCDVELGGHDLARIAQATIVVASPGVPPVAPPLAAARAAGVPVVGELEVALHFLPALRYVAVTGTNGKTTTTAMVGHLLRALGHDAPDAGNIGMPLADLALRPTPPAWAALEMSSFQLHDTPGVAPTVGVVTNLSADHLDRYPDVRSYYADKARLFTNAGPDSRWVLNGDQPEVRSLHTLRDGPIGVTRHLLGEVQHFSLHDPSALAHYDRAGDQLVVLGEALVGRDALSLLGDHNVANALAASLAVMMADASHRTPEARATIATALASFQALEHRLETVGEHAGVQWINDSKATNVSSTVVALEGMRRPYVLLLGGRHKGEPYTALAEPFRRHGRVILAYGEAAAQVVTDLGPLVPVERVGASFADVMARARALARPGDAVLLSPACSSFDMFANYAERGAAFRRLAAGPDAG